MNLVRYYDQIEWSINGYNSKKSLINKLLKKKFLEENEMPVITVDGPKMSKEQKSELVKSFAETASEVMGIPVDAMVILIREVEGENVGVGNILLCDR
jgi:4-oxalocrotonate tautomerase